MNGMYADSLNRSLIIEAYIFNCHAKMPTVYKDHAVLGKPVLPPSTIIVESRVPRQIIQINKVDKGYKESDFSKL